MDEEEHKMLHRRMLYIFIIILLLYFGGATFYHYVEKWRYIDALYFSAATMTTVGYGDITPRTDLGKVFTIIYVFAGVAMALYGLSTLAAHFIETREEFWLQKIKGIKIRQHTKTIWDKLKSLVSYHPEELVKEYEKSVDAGPPYEKYGKKKK